MLPKKQRIPKALSREVFIRGATASSANFLLKFQPSLTEAQKPSRFAVSVSKKVAPTAVMRNRVRRRVYSVLRDVATKVVAGYLVAFVVKKGGEAMLYEIIPAEIIDLLKRAGLYRNFG